MSDSVNAYEGSCKIEVCLNAAESNGYCRDHQKFAKDSELGSETAGTEMRARKANGVSTCLRVAGWAVIVIAAVYGVAASDQAYEFDFIGFISYTLSGSLIGLLFIGMAEIIRLLDRLTHERSEE